jgi:hypothetical protein
MQEKNLKREEKEGRLMEDYVGNESLEEEVQKQECDLAQVEKGLEESTQVLVEDFTKGHIDATMTMTGLQLVRDTREACVRGDLEACKRLELIRGFLERIRPKESAK